MDDELLRSIAGPPGRVVSPAEHGHQERNIGPGGNEVELPSGVAGGFARRHVLTVPAGSVRGDPFTFRLAHTSANYVSVEAHHLGPPDTKFTPPLTLRLSYAGCVPEPPDDVPLRIYVREKGIWVPLESTHYPDQKAVETCRDSLSQYALGAG